MENRDTIFVTGCAGFIGSAFTRSFCEQFPHITIIGIDDFSGGRRDRILPNTIFYEGSITDEELLDQIFRTHHPAYVFHFAALPRILRSWIEPVRTATVNIAGTAALLKKASEYNVRRFIFSSSSSVYGGAIMNTDSIDAIVPIEEDIHSPAPRSPYAIQKYVGEQLCALYSTTYNLDTICLRYFTVFGPGEYGDAPYPLAVFAWLRAIYFPDRVEGFLEGDGTQSRDFCYVDNVVQANMLAMNVEGQFKGDVFNVGHGETTSLVRLRELLERYTGKQLKLQQRPSRPGDVKHTRAGIQKAQRVLGYVPVCNFEEGLKRTVRWYEDVGRHHAIFL